MFLPLFWISWPCSHLLTYSCGAYSIILIFGGWGSERLVMYHLPLLCSTVNPEVFIKFLKRNIVVPRVISRIAQMCFIPHQGLFMCLCFSILLLMALFGGSVGMEDVKATCFSYFAKSNTGSKGKTSHKLWSRCANVWIFLVDDGWELLYMNSLSLVMFLVWAIFSFFSLPLFFWHTLWVCGIPSLGMHLLFLLFL